ncbi:hypothetical protein [Mucilaginibacter sp.]|uniref:hypothetical protein n=1 Tax=Mucilaginibacter sp. TaxID=1882438 RepID=UPI0025D22F72|nr:hypothetical protein [Mucilaginibacter sp.]
MEFSGHFIGSQSHSYNREDVVNSLKDYLDLYLLQKIPNETCTVGAPDIIFYKNSEFWNHLAEVKNYPGKIVKLNSFSILEWLPASPGLFYTEQAIHERKAALNRSKYYVEYEKARPVGNKFVELHPDEKLGMIRGGFGSVRLASKTINGCEKYFLCASSTGISHEGIPIVVEELMYRKLMEFIALNELPVINVIGKLRLLPADSSLLKISYDSSFPKFYLEVLDFEVIKTRSNDDGIISVTIAYSREKEFNWQMSYSFCTFSPSQNDSDLKEGVSWLNDYAVRYSGTNDPLILGDFDEFYDHYQNVQFPLKELMNGKVSAESLKSLQKFFHFEINNNVFEHVYNSKIINNSTVNNSDI